MKLWELFYTYCSDQRPTGSKKKKKKMIIYCRFWTWAHDDMWMKNKAGIKLDPKGQR